MSPLRVPIPYGDDATWTQPLDTTLLTEYVAACKEQARTTKEKGDRLESLLCWLLPHIPGFRAHTVNQFSADHSQEIDMLIWNERHPTGFPSFREKIMVECKNWIRKVDSSDVAWFDWKMRLGGVTEGLLVAANGITGDSSRRHDAESILAHANAEQRRILVITLEEIGAITSRYNLRELLIEKVMGLSARAGLP
ncbi:restriction endonuclease [Phytohabitans houttuyneae]|uniref:Restriction endonuclease type IV Mrr domain-containing protein n=1 Tax=Phytohabitans houttuyneae TaxID=1076126 RepID=A0A6V8K579_9ACTN|nr:restriction endonuclease [Phytohabitans houttuyneae]GFJ77329.1 hypothetical protein Phou_015090 [Phytohabitans houttuyneae]